jgi:signal transduction histidine kinase
MLPVDRPKNLSLLLKDNRQPLIATWMQRVASSLAPIGIPRPELADRIPVFLDDVIAALHPEAAPLPPRSSDCQEHGAQRLRLGFDIGEVVREYDVLHQAILDMADEREFIPDMREQKVLAHWLNSGIAAAVSEYAALRDAEFQRQSTEHLGFIAHEVRNPLSAASMAIYVARTRDDGASPAALEVVERNLRRASDVIDGALTQAFLKTGVAPRLEDLPIESLIDDAVADLGPEVEGRGLRISTSVEQGLRLRADGRLLRSILTNLLHNAAKFSRPDSSISLHARHDADRFVIEVADSCGGLPAGKSEELFAPLVQRHADRTGFGLGLAIVRQAVEAHRGTISVRDRPGVGCVFIVSLPAA